MWKTIIAMLAGNGLASPVFAQTLPTVALVPGESFTIHIDEGGRASMPARGQAQWEPFDIVAARQMAGITPPAAPETQARVLNSAGGVSPRPIPPGEIRIRFLTIADRHALLVVENGQDRALAYRARMTSDGQSRPTDVCVVLPHLPSYEHWPHRIERVELSDFRFIPWVPGRAPTCE
jgi:hypothetical protein